MIGGLIVGITSQVAAAYTSPVYEDVAAFGILVVVLLARPRGIFARRGALAGPWET
jgi:branched-chain amino acid transport system permease protein